MGTYTSEEAVEAITGISITDTSTPTSSQVAEWITEVEARIEERALGLHTATDEYIDVPEYNRGSGIYNFTYQADDDTVRIGSADKAHIVPLTNIRRPLISITKLEKNDESYTSTPNWVELTEGPGDGADFLLLKGGKKQHGYALYFVDNPPRYGPKRLRINYTFGHNVNSSILKEYCTKLVAVNVLEARMGSNQIDSLSYIDGGALGVAMNTRYEERIKRWLDDIREIEERYFPDESTGGGIPHVLIG